MECSEYLRKATEDIGRVLSHSLEDRNITTIFPHDHSGASSSPFRQKLPAYYISIASILAILGIVGNILNIVILNKKRLSGSIDRIEKTVNLGLTSLALSDLCFCTIFFAALFPEDKPLLTPLEYGFPHYFIIYKESLLNIMQLSSTWLTVNIAIGRYFAICRPLHAKGFISIKGVRTAIVTIFLFSIFFNLPRFFAIYYENQNCHQMLNEGGVYRNKASPPIVYTTQSSFLYKHPIPVNQFIGIRHTNLLMNIDDAYKTESKAEILKPPKTGVNKFQKIIYTREMDYSCGCEFTVRRISSFFSFFISSKFYLILASIFYIFLPLTFFSVCNVCLIIALRRSYLMQRIYRTNKTKINNGQRITAVLIAIIMFFIILVIPNDLINFVKSFISDPNFIENFRITNLLLLTNFSINFILYLVINLKFRKTFKSLLFCRLFGLSRKSSFESVSQATGSVPFTMVHKFPRSCNKKNKQTRQLKVCKSRGRLTTSCIQSGKTPSLECASMRATDFQNTPEPFQAFEMFAARKVRSNQFY